MLHVLRGAHAETASPRLRPRLRGRALSTARKDIANGRWQGLRDLLRVTGPAWSVRAHRIRLLAPACAGNSSVESWLAEEPRSPDALVLRAATEVARAFTSPPPRAGAYPSNSGASTGR